MSSTIFNPLGQPVRIAASAILQYAIWGSVVAYIRKRAPVYAPALRHHADTTHHRSLCRGVRAKSAPGQTAPAAKERCRGVRSLQVTSS